MVLRRTAPGVLGLAAVLVLLGALDRLVTLGAVGWAVGLASGAAVTALLGRGLRHASRTTLGPADRVTLARAVLTCGVAGLAADSLAGQTLPVPAVAALASVALALDAVDGVVARRTGTVSALGARFDLETDAFLILVLSVLVSRELGSWVLAIGLARYGLLLVGLVARWAPWLRGQVPARRWRKAVAAYQGIALTVAVGQPLPESVVASALAVGLALLLVSFGTEVVTLRRQSVLAPAGPTTTGYAVPATALDASLSQGSA